MKFIIAGQQQRQIYCSLRPACDYPYKQIDLLTQPSFTREPFFTAFEPSAGRYALPEKFTFPFHYTPHPLCILAAGSLQAHLESQQVWKHNFGLFPGSAGGNIIGKMFGVLVVQTPELEIGYLSAFSGKLAGGNHHARFVPPVFDGLTQGSFLNSGMSALKVMNDEIRALETWLPQTSEAQIRLLKNRRKQHSNNLQQQLFDHYHFLNQAGQTKSLTEIFADASYKNPPAGAGECAAPKLLQYAFQRGMKPLAMAEFWWGQSPKSASWQHGRFYPSCREKCRPILAHMLEGMVLEKPSGSCFLPEK